MPKHENNALQKKILQLI